MCTYYMYFARRMGSRKCSYNYRDLQRVIKELGYTFILEPGFFHFVELTLTGSREHIIKERRRIQDRVKLLDRNIPIIFRKERFVG